MRLFHDNSEGLIAIPRWRAERLGQGSFGSRSEELDLSISGPLSLSKAVIRTDMSGGRIRATTGREQMQHRGADRKFDYSITSSARASSVGGTSRPSAFAALRLITSSYLVGFCTAKSAGFSPLRMRSTYSAALANRPTVSAP
jgi:hypothetical protein